MSNLFGAICTLGRDAEVKALASGHTVMTLALANNTGFGDNKKTTWLRGQLWGKRAEGQLKDYLKKGQQVFVSGEISVNEFTGNDGVKKTTLELNIAQIDLVGGKKESNSPPPAQQPAPQQSGAAYQAAQNGNYQPPPPAYDAPYDDDIPF